MNSHHAQQLRIEPPRQPTSSRYPSGRVDVGWPGLSAALLRSAVDHGDEEFLRSTLGLSCAELLGCSDMQPFIERATARKEKTAC
ncbi:MAG: hypothetical protein OXE49_01460 [Gemmatimonadetes bacterium]|nr:hypothetical protein [Gemmatimonadota bacterium]